MDVSKKLTQLKRNLMFFRRKKLEPLLPGDRMMLKRPFEVESEYKTPKRLKTDDEDKLSIKQSMTSKTEWDAETEFEIQGIRRVKLDDAGNLYVLIKWKNWSDGTNTWEPLSNIRCYEKIINFLERKALDESYSCALMYHYVQKHLYSPFFNIKILSRLLDDELSIDECVRLESWEKSGLREAVRTLDSKTLRNNIIKNFGNELRFVRFIDSREPMCHRLVELYKTTRVALPNEAPIYFENLVDSDTPPENFTFIQDYIYDQSYCPQLAAIGCSCGDCASGDCQFLHHDCTDQRNYLPDGRLEEWARSRRGPIYECNAACECPSTCYNRVTQQGRTTEVVVFKTANDRGWGLRTLTPIKAWTFVTEYLGKVVTSAAAKKSDATYQFDMDFNVEQKAKYVVDAISYGNASHFINHSCNPNMIVFNVWVNDLNPQKPRLAFFACRDIAKHEELTFDYNYQASSSKRSSGLKCRCGEATCRGRL